MAFDRANLFPIVKSGIIASRWGAHFGGKPYFIIDAKLFPGSSGSIVLAKPTYTMLIKGVPHYTKEKIFPLLGVLSGEPPTFGVLPRKESYNVSCVWYAKLIEAIIEKGIPYTVHNDKKLAGCHVVMSASGNEEIQPR